MITYTPPPQPNYNRPKKSSRKIFIIALIIVIVIAVVGIVMRLHDASKLKTETTKNAIPTVAVIKAGQGPEAEEIVLPGNIQPWHDAILYARVSGYLKEWVRTMGMTVKKGDLIATIETPELDAQVHQAEADVKTAEANNALAQSTGARWKKLLKTNSVSKQEADEKLGAALASSATLASSKANLDHLRQLESFKQVRAPFDGVISSRTVDIGSLVSSGSTTQQPLFHVVQSDFLRVYVRVPQSYSSQINKNIVADVYFDEHPGKIYHATYRTTADAIDSTSQTMLTEFQIDNRTGEILAGGYAQVHLRLPAKSVNLRVPVNTLLFRAEGPRIAIVDDQNRAQLQAVTIGRDFGNSVELLAGVEPGQQIIVNPSDSLLSGTQVQIAAPKEKAKDDAAATADAQKNAVPVPTDKTMDAPRGTLPQPGQAVPNSSPKQPDETPPIINVAPKDDTVPPPSAAKPDATTAGAGDDHKSKKEKHHAPTIDKKTGEVKTDK